MVDVTLRRDSNQELTWDQVDDNFDNLKSEIDDIQSQEGAEKVGYLPAGTGAVATDVQTKLRETVSVRDFGGATETVENLRLVNGAVGQQIQLAGYYIPGDGGGWK